MARVRVREVVEFGEAGSFFPRFPANGARGNTTAELLRHLTYEAKTLEGLLVFIAFGMPVRSSDRISVESWNLT